MCSLLIVVIVGVVVVVGVVVLLSMHFGLYWLRSFTVIVVCATHNEAAEIYTLKFTLVSPKPTDAYFPRIYVLLWRVCECVFSVVCIKQCITIFDLFIVTTLCESLLFCHITIVILYAIVSPG